MPEPGLAAAARPLVVLVEDDPMLRRFVELSLEELPIVLSAHADADAAWPVLAAGGWRLLITDLMLPGISGFELIERLAAVPAGRAGRTAVFSAGLQAEARARLEALGVWRLLPKPVSAAVLASCVAEAVEAPPVRVETAHDGTGAGPDVAGAGAARGPGRLDPPPAAGTSAIARAIADAFGGDATLFHAYRASCQRQFPLDLQAGDAALAASDGPALRRVAHNLKSVLLLIGEPEASALARRLEREATGGDTAVPSLWRELRRHIARLAGPAPAADAGPHPG